MEAFLQIIFSGLTLGAMYALSAVGLTLLWGVVGMLNMSQGVMLAIGGYASYSAITYLGLPWPLGLPAAIIGGFVTGLVFYHVIVRWMYRAPAFEVNIIIATVGAAIVLESLMIRVFTGYPLDQPFSLPGGFRIGGIQLPFQTLINLGVAGIMTLGLGWLLRSTRLGRAIRATAQRRDAAQLLGVPVARVYLQVMIMAGIIAAISGVLLTASVANLSPYAGTYPMLKAFFICAIAGLGNIPAAVVASLILAFFEGSIQYLAGGRWGFPAMLGLAIIVLIWRPYGLFGQRIYERS